MGPAGRPKHDATSKTLSEFSGMIQRHAPTHWCGVEVDQILVGQSVGWSAGWLVGLGLRLGCLWVEGFWEEAKCLQRK